MSNAGSQKLTLVPQCSILISPSGALYMTICHYCWNAGLHRFNFYKKDQRFCVTSVALYRPSISPRTTQSSPNVHSDHFLPFCCISIGKPGHNIVHYLVKELSGEPGWFGFLFTCVWGQHRQHCSPGHRLPWERLSTLCREDFELQQRL